MKEFIEKLIGRLEEELIPLNQEITKYFYELKDTDNPKYIYSVGRSNALTDFKYTIKQLAEEYNKKDFYEITLNGCDDDTCFVMEITENEHEFLLKVSEKANETSTYACMPRLYVEKAEMIEPKGE